MAIKKVTFTLPEELVRRLKRVPTGKRSTFVNKALQRELDRLAAVAVLKRMKGKTIWKAKHHPDLLTSRDFARYRPMRSRLAG